MTLGAPHPTRARHAGLASEKRYWRAYSIPYSLAETTAQFLGARSHWKARESKFWKRFDDWACSD